MFDREDVARCVDAHAHDGTGKQLLAEADRTIDVANFITKSLTLIDRF